MDELLKKSITSKFDKEKFKLDNCGTADDGLWEGVDASIRDFIKTLNESPDIMTIYSCEGHKQHDEAYMVFTVSEAGWDLFWREVLPQLSSRLYVPAHKVVTGYQATAAAPQYYGFSWTVAVTDDANGSCLSLHFPLVSFESTNGNLSWQAKKLYVWNLVKELFLKYYKKEKIEA